jgi:hypothetical protein
MKDKRRKINIYIKIIYIEALLVLYILGSMVALLMFMPCFMEEAI